MSIHSQNQDALSRNHCRKIISPERRQTIPLVYAMGFSKHIRRAWKFSYRLVLHPTKCKVGKLVNSLFEKDISSSHTRGYNVSGEKKEHK